MVPSWTYTHVYDGTIERHNKGGIDGSMGVLVVTQMVDYGPYLNQKGKQAIGGFEACRAGTSTELDIVYGRSESVRWVFG